jgi:cyclophilin family peptidyl-prolyl cis-trans isomerase
MRQFSVLLLSLLFISFAVAQEPVPPAAAEPKDTTDGAIVEANYVPTEAEAEALGPKNKEFMQTFYQFREIAKKLTALKVEYQDAKQDRQSAIDTEYDELYKEGAKVHKRLLDLGLDARDEAPNRNQFVNSLLYATVEWNFRRENFEESVRIFKRLVVKGLSKEAAVEYAYAGFAALLSMNYDEAEAWLKIASDGGYLERVTRSMSETQKGQEQVQTLRVMMQQLPVSKKDWTKEQEIRKAETEAGEKDPAKKLPRVEIETSKGKIVIELFENEAPNTVASFISLVEKGFYDGTVFHRVLPLFMAQGGDPTGTGNGGPAYKFNDECGSKFPQARKHFRGSLSMANSGPNTNGSQFFLTFVPTSFLNGRHTVFGRIVEGIEVLAEIQRVDPQDEDAKVPEIDRIKTAKVLNKREHPYEVKKSGR